jgi:hypothetical protein
MDGVFVEAFSPDCHDCGSGRVVVEMERENVAAAAETTPGGEVVAGRVVVSVTRWCACDGCGAAWAETAPAADEPPGPTAERPSPGLPDALAEHPVDLGLRHLAEGDEPQQQAQPTDHPVPLLLGHRPPRPRPPQPPAGRLVAHRRPLVFPPAARRGGGSEGVTRPRGSDTDP